MLLTVAKKGKDLLGCHILLCVAPIILTGSSIQTGVGSVSDLRGVNMHLLLTPQKLLTCFGIRRYMMLSGATSNLDKNELKLYTQRLSSPRRDN